MIHATGPVSKRDPGTNLKTALRAVALTLAAIAGSGVSADPAPKEDGLKIERVVLLMRHGIRPPTKDPAPLGYAAGSWPSWPVDWGLLTPRGAAGIRLLAAGDRARYVSRGLLPAHGCPRAGAIVASSSAKPRSIRTAEVYLETFLPGCPVNVVHPADEGQDAIFHPLASNPPDFDGHRAYEQALALAPAGGLAAEVDAHRSEFALLTRVLGCCAARVCEKNGRPAGCTPADFPSTLVEHAHDRPKLEGPLAIGSTVSQIFLLEYLEGMPMARVGWGRVTREEIETLLRFHPLKFRYENGPPYVAQRAAGPLLARIVEALSAGPGGARFTLLLGHDTNLADVGSLLGLKWRIDSYPEGDVPPGGALGFELLGDESGARAVRAFFRGQTMDQLRDQQPLTGATPAHWQQLSIPGCDTGTDPLAPCPLDRFTRVIGAKLTDGSGH